MIKSTSDASFKADVLDQEGLVLVDFWAEWCGPCKLIAPVLEEVASAFGHQLRILKLSVDENPEITGRFGVRTIPTLILFKNGEALESKGPVSRSALEEWIKQAL